MRILIDRQFEKDIFLTNDAKLNVRVESVIRMLHHSANLRGVSNLRKLTGFKTYYRIRIGDYRIGFELIDADTVMLIRFLHRKDIYKRFP